MKKDYRVRFKFVDVYYFSRCVGIDKVPERGNNPLGMEWIHFNFENFDITKRKLKSVQLYGDGDNINSAKLCTSTPISSKHIHLGQGDEDNESVHSVISIDYTPKSLQPMNPMQRKKCLEGSGVVSADSDDISKNPKLLSKLRENRKQVGCKCSNSGKCDSNKCVCSSEGISCQSDGNKFPCKCGEKCSNKAGKRIYSFSKIKFHYNHTLNRNAVSNEDVDINVLSTLTGDCAICCSLSDEMGKSHAQTNHQTRSRKRVSENNPENMKIFKQMITIEENNVLTNGSLSVPSPNVLSDIQLLGSRSFIAGDNSDNKDYQNNGTSFDSFNFSLKPNTISVEINKRQSSIIEDKENIDYNCKNETTTSLAFSVPNKVLLDFHSSIQVQIPSGSFVSPCSSLPYQNSHWINNSDSYFNNLPIISPTASYHESFLNEEYLNVDSLCPLSIKSPVIRLNPISLTPRVDISNDKFFHNKIDSLKAENDETKSQVSWRRNRYSEIFKSNSDVKDSFSDSLDSSRTSLSSDNVSDNPFSSPKKSSSDNNSNMTDKLQHLHLAKLNSDPLLDKNNCEINSPIISDYSIRVNLKYENQNRLPIEKKSEIITISESAKFVNPEPCREVDNCGKTCQRENPLKVLEQTDANSIKIKFRPSVDISFFDIPLSNDVNDCGNVFQLDPKVIETWTTE